MNTIVNCAVYAEGRRIANIEINEIGEVLKQPGRFVWIGLHEPSTEMLSQIQKEFCLHDLAIEDALSAHQRPKLETYGDTLFIVMRTAQINKGEHKIDFGETHFFLGENFIITIRHGSSLAYTEVRTRCEKTPHLLKKGPGFALYAVMDFIVDQYFPVIHDMEQEVEVIEEKIFDSKPSKETTEAIYHLKRELLELKRTVSPLIDICNRLMRFDLELIPEDTRPYFRDVYDHSIRINEMADNARELLATALEANFSLISISQSDVSKRFAGWAAIIAVPTMVAGIYGMNFQYMPELNLRWAYPVVLAITFGLSIGLFIFFRRSKWL